MSDFMPLRTKCCNADFETINRRGLYGNIQTYYLCGKCLHYARIYYDNTRRKKKEVEE
jgi:hypothetical protein